MTQSIVKIKTLDECVIQVTLDFEISENQGREISDRVLEVVGQKHWIRELIVKTKEEIDLNDVEQTEIFG
jgi:hypothetical protein